MITIVDAASSCRLVGAYHLRTGAVGATIGLLFDDQEAELARAISDAFELSLP